MAGVPEQKREQISAVIPTATEKEPLEWSGLVTADGSAWSKIVEKYTKQVWEMVNRC